MRTISCVAGVVGMVLGCAGGGAPAPPVPSPEPVVVEAPDPEPPAPEVSWVDQAVEAALQWEIMPGTSGEPTPERTAELKAFFEAHPEYQDPDERERLADIACALGTEAGHARLAGGIEFEPVVVEVKDDAWKVLLIHHSQWCTSDDWGYYSSEVREGAEARGLTLAHANATRDIVVVKRGDEELAREKLSGQGYLLLRPHHSAMDIEHDMSDGVLAELDEALDSPAARVGPPP